MRHLRVTLSLTLLFVGLVNIYVVRRGKVFPPATPISQAVPRARFAGPAHQEPYAAFGMWEGDVRPGMDKNHESLFLGIETECSFESGSSCAQKGSREARVNGLPPLSDHTFEWHDLIGALCLTHDTFRMLELGAGWAKWIVDAVGLGRASGRRVVAIGVEAQPKHCEFAKAHIRNNKAGGQAILICGAVGAEDGFVEMPALGNDTSKTNFGYGLQHILDGKRAGLQREGAQILRVPAYSLCTLVHREEFLGQPVDFVSLDVQSFEYAILKDSPENRRCLDDKVRVLHISMHRMEENDARAITTLMVGALGWQLTRYLPLMTSKHPTPFGKVDIVDGRLCFVNRRLAPDFYAPALDDPLMIHRGSYTGTKDPKRPSKSADWGPGDYITDIFPRYHAV